MQRSLSTFFGEPLLQNAGVRPHKPVAPNMIPSTILREHLLHAIAQIAASGVPRNHNQLVTTSCTRASTIHRSM